jgi:hypothetical protein
MLIFIVLLHVLWLGLVSLPRSDRVSGSQDDLKDSSSWCSPPLVLLRDIQNDILSNYDYKDSSHAPVQPGVSPRPGHNSQDGVSQEEEADQAPLSSTASPSS